MDSNFIKAGVKILAAIAAIFAGKTLAEKGYKDYKRGKEQQANNSKKQEKVTA